jgi:hypothetical protein
MTPSGIEPATYTATEIRIFYRPNTSLGACGSVKVPERHKEKVKEKESNSLNGAEGGTAEVCLLTAGFI